MAIPRPIRAFRDALLEVTPGPITIPGTQPTVVGRPGIRESTRIQYNEDDFQELGRAHEYTFALPEGRRLELSVQLYMNDRDHWRLFAYSVVDGTQSPGMLFSVNLTSGQDESHVLVLGQTLMLSYRALTAEDRSQGADALANRLRGCGIEVNDRRVELGRFDTKKKSFVGTTAADFLRDFVVTAVIKGHYMRNKGFELPGFDAAAQPRRSAVVAPNAHTGPAFDPDNWEDARQRATADVVRRPGQSAFRDALLSAYDGRCAVTGCDFPGTLAAAHIVPHRGEHTDHVQNGLLLRADIHVLFDRRLLAIDVRTWKVMIAPALRGTVYQELQGKLLNRPKDPSAHPNPQALDDHRRKAGL